MRDFDGDGTDAAVSDAQVAGDLNGDGLPDLAVSVQAEPGSTLNDMYLYFGRAAWPAVVSLADADVHVPRNSAYLGVMRAPLPEHVGDIDGDGLDDLVPRIPSESFTSEMNGVLFVLRGRHSGDRELSTDDADLRITGTEPGQGLGESYWTAVDDLDGDGCADIVVGNASRIGYATAGEVDVFLGSAAE
jgi:hypothetical protein